MKRLDHLWRGEIQCFQEFERNEGNERWGEIMLSTSYQSDPRSLFGALCARTDVVVA